MGSVFISYSHQDQDWLEELRSFLKPLERDFSLSAWADDRIKPGQDWKAEIDGALGQADIALALVTQVFLASDFIATQELPYLLEKHGRGELTLIPVFYEPSDVAAAAPALAALQGYGTPDKPLSKLDKTQRQEQLVALSGRLRGLATPAAPAYASQTSRIEARGYALSIYVTRQGERWECQYRVPGHEPFLATRRPWADVWQPLQKLLDMLADGNREAVQGVIATAGSFWGQVLFDALFGVDDRQHETIFRAAFQQGKDRARPTPVYIGGLRLRIASPLPEIGRLPWRLMTWKSHSLAGNDWVFISGNEPDPERDIHSTVPDEILLLDGLDDAESHWQRLRQTVQAVWNDTREPLPYARRTRNLEQLDKALAGINPHWVYVRGQIDGDGAPALRLGAKRLPLRDLAKRLAKQPPAALFFNTAQDQALDLAGFFPGVPLVLSRQGRQPPPDALDLPVAWLHAWLGQGLDPVAALHGLKADPVEVHSLAVRADYRHWQTDLPSENLVTSLAHLLLDRIAQKGATNQYLGNLLGSHTARVMTLVPYGETGNQMAQVHEQLLDSARVALHGRAHINCVRLQFPPGRDNLYVDLGHELAGQLGLDSESGETVEQLLRRYAPSPEPNCRRVLWLHWGLFGHPPSGAETDYQAPLNGSQLKDWLGFVSGYLATRCPPDIRLICSLAIEAQADKHAAIAQLLNATNAEWTEEKCRLRILPRLDNVPHHELLDFLTDHAQGCPQSLRKALADLLISATAGQPGSSPMTAWYCRRVTGTFISWNGEIRTVWIGRSSSYSLLPIAKLPPGMDTHSGSCGGFGAGARSALAWPGGATVSTTDQGSPLQAMKPASTSSPRKTAAP